MKLLLDIGNTRVKWALSLDGQMLATGDLTHRALATATDTWLAALPRAPTVAYAVTVGGAAAEVAIAAALRARWGIELVGIRSTACWGRLRNAYAQPERLGADRWAALAAAWHGCNGPVCVADAGTALTLDMLAADGTHTGGLIVPGLGLLRASLNQGTSDIAVTTDADEQLSPGLWYGTDTTTAVLRGTALMLASLIDRFIESAAVPPDVLLTGGDAPVLLPLLRHRAILEPHLVLRGLDVLTDA